jgi:hypothetical protein
MSTRASIMEHLALECTLDLQEFCTRLQAALDLPEFGFDAENLTEWGQVEFEYIEYNVSRPYAAGILQQWDPTVPPGCNFGISLTLYQPHPHAHDQEWSYNHLALPVGQIIADEFQVPVHYHRTWFGAGLNTERQVTFQPTRV